MTPRLGRLLRHGLRRVLPQTPLALLAIALLLAACGKGGSSGY